MNPLVIVYRPVIIPYKKQNNVCAIVTNCLSAHHDDVIKWKHFPRYWPFERGIHRWIPLTKASDAELWCFLWSAPWINGWVNNREAGNLIRYRVHYDVTVMLDPYKKMTLRDVHVDSHHLQVNCLSSPYRVVTCLLSRVHYLFACSTHSSLSIHFWIRTGLHTLMVPWFCYFVITPAGETLRLF